MNTEKEKKKIFLIRRRLEINLLNAIARLNQIGAMLVMNSKNLKVLIRTEKNYRKVLDEAKSLIKDLEAQMNFSEGVQIRDQQEKLRREQEQEKKII